MELDVVKVVKWWQKSAVRGDTDALYKLGMCYENGIGIEKDIAEALNWYYKSAN